MLRNDLTKKDKPLLREIKEDVNEKRKTLCSWTGNVSVDNKVIFHKLICGLKAITMKIPVGCTLFGQSIFY